MRSVIGLAHEYKEIIEVLEEHEKLCYPYFNEQTAWELGSIIRQRFINEKLPLGLSGNIQIRAAGHIAHGDALVYFAAVVGSIPPGNCTIVSGKANVVTYFGKSSFLTRINVLRSKVTLAERGLDSPRYFMHGGAFPIRLAGSPYPVAIAVVSGMPDMADDHQIIIDSIQEHLELMGKR